jgi:hypothetical protein
MNAISIRQPWAWLIVNGLKDIENRTWATRYRGPLFIHAGKSIPYESECEEIEERFQVKLPASYDLGGFVGKAHLDDCVTSHKSKWFFGPFGFVLSRAVVIPFVPWTGRLGLFNVPDVPENLRQNAPRKVSVVLEPELFQKL